MPSAHRVSCGTEGAQCAVRHGDPRPCCLPCFCRFRARCACAPPPGSGWRWRPCPPAARWRNRAIRASRSGWGGPGGRRRAKRGYRGKPIRLVVPFLAGGGPDMTARTVAQKMAEHNGWSVLVDNRPGASGNLGVDSVAKSAPDGHTLVLGQTSNLAINPALYPELPYDPLKDLVPVALVSSSPMVLVTHPKSAFKTYADVVAAA